MLCSILKLCWSIFCYLSRESLASHSVYLCSKFRSILKRGVQYLLPWGWGWAIGRKAGGEKFYAPHWCIFKLTCKQRCCIGMPSWCISLAKLPLAVTFWDLLDPKAMSDPWPRLAQKAWDDRTCEADRTNLGPEVTDMFSLASCFGFFAAFGWSHRVKTILGFRSHAVFPAGGFCDRFAR